MDKLTPEQRSRLMSRIGSKNTKPEITVRRLVFSLGYRYRLHSKHLPGSPDLVFPGRKKVIFVNGCFWHDHSGCQLSRPPKSHTEFWKTKIDRNRKRDKENIASLEAAGWRVLTIWQCELKNTEELSSRLINFLQSK